MTNSNPDVFDRPTNEGRIDQQSYRAPESVPCLLSETAGSSYKIKDADAQNNEKSANNNDVLKAGFRDYREILGSDEKNETSDESSEGSDENSESSDESNESSDSSDESYVSSDGAALEEQEDEKDQKDEDKPGRKIPEALQKKIDGLIESLGDDEFDKRQNASKELRELGSTAWNSLEKARSHPDLEIRFRSGKILQSISEQPLTKQSNVTATHNEALAEIAKDGKISPKTAEKFEKLIKAMDGHFMSDKEYEIRRDKLDKTAYNQQGEKKDRLDALRKTSELFATKQVPPVDQVRLDFADALTKSGDKGKAIKVLGDAIKANPELRGSASFRLLARDAGAFKDKSFAETVDKATGRKNLVNNWAENKRAALYDTVDHMAHETMRKGPTDAIQKQWKTTFDELARQAKDEKGLAGIAEIAKQNGQRSLVEAFGRHGKHDDAVKLMTQMIKEDPQWVNTAWMYSMSNLNEARNNKEYSEAVKTARKTVPRRYDGQDP
ncbi:MAG: hypothetical protein K2X93_04105 [Candidatus Obscuribacterales bacterium]|nr:hypothetical protein [Candidatus Obscuribacterales bacterium]